MTRWYVRRDGKQEGPLSSSVLKQYANDGRILPIDLVRREDTTEWRSASQVHGLFPKGTAADTPPPLPQERRVAAPGLLVYIRHHWEQTKGTWFLPVLIGPFLILAASLFKPLIGWPNLAAFTVLLGLLSLSSFVLYLVVRAFRYAQGRWEVTEETNSRLARFAHDAGLLTIPILTLLLAVEYFTPERGLLVATIPQLQVLQDDLIGHRKPLPAFSDWFRDTGQTSEAQPGISVQPDDLPAVSTPDESLANAQQMALNLLATLTEYRVEESLVKHFESNAGNAERALEQSNDILHRGGKKPHILDVLRKPESALRNLEIPPDGAILGELQKCRENIDSITTRIRERRENIEHQEALLAKAKAGSMAERRELEASFKKYPAMKEEQKQQQRDRLESRERSTTAPFNNEIASIERDVSQLERTIAELKQREPTLAMALAESIKRNTVTYFREINNVGPVLHSAGLPDERNKHEPRRSSLYATLFNKLHAAERQMKELCEESAPQAPSGDGLQYLGGITHLIEGDRYCIKNQIITIPDKYKPLYLNGRAGPNKVAISGAFRFVSNSTGKNGFDAVINVELYKCDTEFSEASMRLREHERECHSFLKHFEPLEFHDRDDGIEPLIKVLVNLLGEEKVAAAFTEGNRKFEEALATREPFLPIVMPKAIGNEQVDASDVADAKQPIAKD